MRKLLIILFSLLIIGQYSFAQEIQYHHPESTIIILHPTVRNIQTTLFLAGTGIFPVPDNFQVTGVYHKQAAYNYGLSAAYIADNNITNFNLLEITDTLTPSNIYSNNNCSQIFRQLFENSQGAIFFGGPDIPPVCYGQKTNLLTVISDPNRHYLELSLMFHLLGGSQNPNFVPLLRENDKYAILGICLGMQTMNVATGGTLIQDIPTEIYNLYTAEDVLLLDQHQQHRNYDTHTDVDQELMLGHFHQILYDKYSVFDVLSEESPFVWSSHHQCIDESGLGLVPVAYSTDMKIIEAVVHEEYPNVLGVQFHPEVQSIFMNENKLKMKSGQTELFSYPELFPGEKGMNFHKAFWKYAGTLFFD